MIKFNIKLIMCLLMICLVACGNKEAAVTKIEVIEETIPECIYISEKDELYKQVKIVVSKEDDSKEEIFLDETMLNDIEKEKLNSSGIKEISISYKGKEAKFSVCVDEKVESTYETGRKLNVFYKIYYNYSNESGKIVCKENVIKGHYTHKQNQVQYLSAETIIKRYDTAVEAFDKKPAANIITTNTICFQSSKEIESKIKTIMSKDIYKYLENGAEKEEELVVKKNVLKLSEDNLLAPEISNFNEAVNEYENIFSVVNAVLSTNNEGSTTINLRIEVNENFNGIYNLDFQLFGTVKDDIYPLIGYYNLSNNVILTYVQSARVSSGLELDYLYLKAIYKDLDGIVHEIILKQKVDM